MIQFNSEILKDLIKNRMVIPKETLEQFHDFCNQAINFEEDWNEPYFDKNGNERFHAMKGRNPKFLTCKLKSIKINNKSIYVFTQSNLRDFKEFVGKKYTMKYLYEILNDASDDKSTFKYKSTKIDGKYSRIIRIQKNFLK